MSTTYKHKNSSLQPQLLLMSLLLLLTITDIVCLYGVQTIPALGYWALDNIRQNWMSLSSGNIFICCDIQYDIDQIAVGTAPSTG